jgi:hypothetical protein
MAGSAAGMAAMFNKIDPEEHREALSYDLQRLLNLARR